MKKMYSAPEAQIICLVPEASVAAQTEWNPGNAGWKTDGWIFWSDESTIDTETASKVAWYDFGMDEINNS